jgi:hypothetical protein
MAKSKQKMDFIRECESHPRNSKADQTSTNNPKKKHEEIAGTGPTRNDSH